MATSTLTLVATGNHTNLARQFGPANIPDRVEQAKLYVVSSQFTDPAESISAGVEVSQDGGVTWRVFSNFTAFGGTDRFGNPNQPSIFFDVPMDLRLEGIARGYCNTFGTFNFSLRLDLIRAD